MRLYFFFAESVLHSLHRLRRFHSLEYYDICAAPKPIEEASP